MKIIKNKNGTYDIKDMSLGKLMALNNALEKAKERGTLTTLQTEIHKELTNVYEVAFPIKS